MDDFKKTIFKLENDAVASIEAPIIQELRKDLEFYEYIKKKAIELEPDDIEDRRSLFMQGAYETYKYLRELK